MESLNLAVINSLVSTLMIILIYTYLYFLYRERFMGLWAVAWFILMSRYALFDSGLLTWKDSLLGFFIFQSIIIVSAFLLLRGIYDFIDKPFNKKFLLFVVSCLTILNTFADSIFPSPFYKMIFPIFVGTVIGVWLGIIFIRLKGLKGFGHYFTGSAYLLWDIFNLTMPFAVHSHFLANWGYTIGGFLRLSIGIGTLLVYFEKVRNDLVKNEHRFRVLSENAADIIYAAQIRPVRRIGYISPAVFKITGYTSEEFYQDHRLPLKIIHPEDRNIALQFLHSLDRVMQEHLILRLIHKNQTIIWIEQKCVPILGDHNELTAIQGIVRDISERKNLEVLASSVDKMSTVRNMAASVAHEIRNPLTTVHGYLQFLSRKKHYESDSDKFQLMMDELDRANKIIEEYLSLSRKRPVRLMSCSLNQVIEAVLPLLQANANQAEIELKTNLADLPEIMLDENEIRQLILNLVRNGIEAMGDGGELIIRTFIKDSHAVLSICDQGSGIPENFLSQIGTPFMTTKSDGTGLGLSVCYQIAAHHNANIKIDTGAHGTTFLIYFQI